MKFHERFDIPVGTEEARIRFVNRACNWIASYMRDDFDVKGRRSLERAVASELGIRINPSDEIFSLMDKGMIQNRVVEMIGNDFYKCLQALEAIYNHVKHFYRQQGREKGVNQSISTLLKQSEIDLGIKWKNGKFTRSGAELLDEKLVSDPLKWLRMKGYESVTLPFEKGLSHFLESERRPELLTDVITDIYEALEALAKVVTKRDKDLSANAELFIRQVKSSSKYTTLLKDIIAYANDYRHAARVGQLKESPSAAEVESFIYLTGVFIRLAMRSMEQ